MPELPELEAFVIAQRERLTAEPVESVPLVHFALMKTFEPPPSALAGRPLVAVRRRAKRLLFEGAGGLTLVVHLMSAGRLTVGAKRMRSAVLVVRFESGLELVLAEPGSKRRAAAWLLDSAGLEAELAGIGPEPLDPAFTPDALRAALDSRPGQLHSTLRDQRAIAGIGRAFANEILWAAMLSPFQRTATLDDEQLGRLHAAIVGVLGDAVTRLVPLSDKGLVGNAKRGHIVHDRLGETCPRCADQIRRVSYEEHTIYYCATCQTGGRVLADRRMSRLLR
jgi:formamidopyrimidine-DNA glycosylase